MGYLIDVLSLSVPINLGLLNAILSPTTAEQYALLGVCKHTGSLTKLMMECLHMAATRETWAEEEETAAGFHCLGTQVTVTVAGLP